MEGRYETNLRGLMAQMRSGMRADLRPERGNFETRWQPEISDFRLVRANFTPERTERVLGLRGLIFGLRGQIWNLKGPNQSLRSLEWGTYLQKYGWTAVWKFSPVIYRTSAH